jgi:hypothetical protein
MTVLGMVGGRFATRIEEYGKPFRVFLRRSFGFLEFEEATEEEEERREEESQKHIVLCNVLMGGGE